MSAATDAVATFVALVLAVSAAHKLFDLPRLAAATAKLMPLHGAHARRATLLLAAIEVGAALAVLAPSTRQIGAAAVAILWMIYCAALFRVHRHADGSVACGCTFARAGAGAKSFILMRPAVLALAAMFVAVAPSTQGAPFLQSIACAAALFVLLASADELAALPRQRTERA